MGDIFQLSIDTSLPPTEVLSHLFSRNTDELEIRHLDRKDELVLHAANANFGASIHETQLDKRKHPHRMDYYFQIKPTYDIFFGYKREREAECHQAIIEAVIKLLEKVPGDAGVFYNDLMLLLRQNGEITICDYIGIWTSENRALLPPTHEKEWLITG